MLDSIAKRLSSLRHSWLRIVLLLIIAAFVALLSPLFLPDDLLSEWFLHLPLKAVTFELPHETQQKWERKEVGEGVVREFTFLRNAVPGTRLVDITPFVAAEYGVYMFTDSGERKVSWNGELSRILKLRNFSVAVATALVAYLSIRLLAAVKWPAKEMTATSRVEEMSVDAALRFEARRAWDGAQRFYTGSIYLLVSGVIMSFVGMGVFVWTYPSIVGDQPSNDHWVWLAPSIRGIGLLVFVEAVAWFLLRQYRAATEDFKAFHRIYLRRTNLFIARQALAEIKSFEKSRKIAEALLAEDQSGRLSEGQSTEAIEAMKVDESNPVFKMFSDVLRRVSEGDAEKPKPKPKKGTEDK